jgi:cation/acetate symporter
MIAIFIFAGFVAFIFWLSWYLGQKAKSADGFFVASGEIHWMVNGIALTGGYLSAASFLGICGMIAFKGFDGFLYSIGFLSGWIVALFVVAEPLRKLGKYTLADALGARFESKNIHLAASISTLVICLCYLVPQLVGAGVLIEPLLGIAHHWGVLIVGGVVIIVVMSAGMSSTTYVQFIKASMLIIFSLVIVITILVRGVGTETETRNTDGHLISNYTFQNIPVSMTGETIDWAGTLAGTSYSFQQSVPLDTSKKGSESSTRIILEHVIPVSIDEENIASITSRGQDLMINLADYDIPVLDDNGSKYIRIDTWWKLTRDADGGLILSEMQDIIQAADGTRLINGLPESRENGLLSMGGLSRIGNRSGYSDKNRPIGPHTFLALFADPDTRADLPKKEVIDYNGRIVTLLGHNDVSGSSLMRPGRHFNLSEGNLWGRVNFISLMLALLFGTAALPHVLIRYYTVKNSIAARKSTIVAISAIGLFYILTMFLGLGAIANGVLNPLSDNMSAPLLARAMGEILFAIITALAFATVLGTVAGLIVAASGAVANDFMDRYLKLPMKEKGKVLAARITALVVGAVSIILGILFKNINVGFLVGWAFAVAASANFPAIIMVLFWKRTTSTGIVASIIVGVVAALGLILMGPDMFVMYGLPRESAWVPINQPALISMPISFLVLIVVSLLTGKSSAVNK